MHDSDYEKSDGVMKAESVVQYQETKKHISNFKFQDICDPLFVMIERCKWKKSRENPFIPSFQNAPNAMCILVTDQQLNKMVCFCTNNKEFLIAGIDPKFNLGDFSITLSTYRHLNF